MIHIHFNQRRNSACGEPNAPAVILHLLWFRKQIHFQITEGCCAVFIKFILRDSQPICYIQFPIREQISLETKNRNWNIILYITVKWIKATWKLRYNTPSGHKKILKTHWYQKQHAQDRTKDLHDYCRLTFWHRLKYEPLLFQFWAAETLCLRLLIALKKSKISHLLLHSIERIISNMVRLLVRFFFMTVH